MKFFTGLALMVSIIFSVYYAGAESREFKAVVDSDGVQRVEVTAGEFFFDPAHIIVKVNIPVEIKIRKEPSMVPHDFALKAPEAGMDILEPLSSKPKLIKFTPSKPGKYEFFCDKSPFLFGSHKNKGMKGILEVVE